jgi:phosphoribosylanthranilate isomerase
MAAEYGADFIGILFSPLSKRCVDLKTGKKIAQATRKKGAEPIAVFVNETLEEILNISKATGIKMFQLHGDLSKKAAKQLSSYGSLIYALVANEQKTPLEEVDFLLFDASKESAVSAPFDWTHFSPPKNKKWILAGGLTPDNVAEAIKTLSPDGVDVASGVEDPITLRKNPALLKAFIERAKRAGKP